MKTLDEVIKDMENCVYQDSDCSQCPALHYLRLFQKHEERVRGQLDDLKQEYRPNEPLDWETLKTMEGKPVWVEDRAFIDGEEYFDSKWAVVCQVKDKFAILSIAEGDTCFQKCNYVYDIPGTDHWQAFRKERS